jgi:hypothetical protein
LRLTTLTTLLLSLMGVLGNAALADGACTGSPGEICFDAGEPNLITGSSLTTFVSADDFALDTAGDDLMLSVEFWTIEASADWEGVVEYFIFEDIEVLDAANGRGPGETPLYSGSGQNITREATGRIGEESPLTGMIEFHMLFDFEAPVSLEADRVYWLGLRLRNRGGVGINYWLTTLKEGESYPPGLGFGSISQTSLQATFDNWSENIEGPKQQQAFNIVPEPTTWLQQAGALGVLLHLVRRRRVRSQAESH